MGLWDKLRSYSKLLQPQEGKANLERLQELLGYHFRDESIALLAMTHRSYHRGSDSNRPSNERLEFLGDSVLGLVISDQLYRDYPDLREGELTKIKAMLVNESTLANISVQVGLNEHVLLSSEEVKLGGRGRSSIVSDALESILGAVYLDGGFDAVRDVVLRLVYVHRDEITSDRSQQNFKGELLELTQAAGIGMPRYDVVSEKGPDHEKEFDVVVSIGDQKYGFGNGSSKKEAEQKAAEQALAQLRMP